MEYFEEAAEQLRPVGAEAAGQLPPGAVALFSLLDTNSVGKVKVEHLDLADGSCTGGRFAREFEKESLFWPEYRAYLERLVREAGPAVVKCLIENLLLNAEHQAALRDSKRSQDEPVLDQLAIFPMVAKGKPDGVGGGDLGAPPASMALPGAQLSSGETDAGEASYERISYLIGMRGFWDAHILGGGASHEAGEPNGGDDPPRGGLPNEVLVEQEGTFNVLLEEKEKKESILQAAKAEMSSGLGRTAVEALFGGPIASVARLLPASGATVPREAWLKMLRLVKEAGGVACLEWLLSYLDFNIDANEAAGPHGVPVPKVGGPPSGWRAIHSLLLPPGTTDAAVPVAALIAAHGGDGTGLLSSLIVDAEDGVVSLEAWENFLTGIASEGEGKGHQASRRLVWGLLREAERQKLKKSLPPRARPVHTEAELLPEETRRGTRLHRALLRGGVVMAEDVAIAHAGDAGGVVSLLDVSPNGSVSHEAWVRWLRGLKRGEGGVDLTRFLDYLERCVSLTPEKPSPPLGAGEEDPIPFREGMPGASGAVEEASIRLMGLVSRLGGESANPIHAVLINRNGRKGEGPPPPADPAAAGEATSGQGSFLPEDFGGGMDAGRSTDAVVDLMKGLASPSPPTEGDKAATLLSLQRSVSLRATEEAAHEEEALPPTCAEGKPSTDLPEVPVVDAVGVTGQERELVDAMHVEQKRLEESVAKGPPAKVTHGLPARVLGAAPSPLFRWAGRFCCSSALAADELADPLGMHHRLTCVVCIPKWRMLPPMLAWDRSLL